MSWTPHSAPPAYSIGRTADISDLKCPSSSSPYGLLHHSRWHPHSSISLKHMKLPKKKTFISFNLVAHFQNLGHLWFISFLHTPHLLHQEVLASFSECIPNLTNFHHLYCYHLIRATRTSHLDDWKPLDSSTYFCMCSFAPCVQYTVWFL